jgi:hypothetical protein
MIDEVEPKVVAPTEPFPRNLMEFVDRFGTDEACLGYLRTMRWPGGGRQLHFRTDDNYTSA